MVTKHKSLNGVASNHPLTRSKGVTPRPIKKPSRPITLKKFRHTLPRTTTVPHHLRHITVVPEEPMEPRPYQGDNKEDGRSEPATENQNDDTDNDSVCSVVIDLATVVCCRRGGIWGNPTAPTSTKPCWGVATAEECQQMVEMLEAEELDKGLYG